MNFKTTDSDIRELLPYPIKTIEGTDAEMEAFKVTFLGNLDKTPYIICNVQDSNNKTYYQWNGLDWLNMSVQGGGANENLIAVDFALNGIFAFGGSFGSIPIQVLIAQLLDVGAYTQVEGKICVSYATTGASTGEIRLFDFTDSLVIAGTTVALPNGIWVYKSSDYIDLTPQAGKAIRLQGQRIGGNGGDQLQIEAAKLLLKFS